MYLQKKKKDGRPDIKQITKKNDGRPDIKKDGK